LINVKCKFFSNRKAIKRSLRQKNNISVCYTMASRVTINNVHKQGLLISAWTIDNKRIAHKLVKRNLDFITTNDINLLD
jgi:glycerophosphoryl diester phosphodiesterase